MKKQVVLVEFVGELSGPESYLNSSAYHRFPGTDRAFWIRINGTGESFACSADFDITPGLFIVRVHEWTGTWYVCHKNDQTDT